MGLINTIFTKFHETLRTPFTSPWKERTPRRLNYRGASSERKVSARLIPEADINSYG